MACSPSSLRSGRRRRRWTIASSRWCWWNSRKKMNTFDYDVILKF